MSKTNYDSPEKNCNIPESHANSAKSTGKKSSRRGRFWKGLGIYAAVLALIIAAGLVVFWNFIKAYELSRPDTAISSIVESKDESYWLELVASTPLHFSEFEDSQLLTEKYLLSKIRGQDISFRKHSSVYTDDAPAYIVYAGDSPFCRAKLVPEEKSSVGFGFTSWTLGDFQPLESFALPSSRTIELTVKEDSEIILNGKTVSPAYELPDDDIYVSVYRIENIYEDYTLDVIDPEGAAETPVSVSGDSYLYPIPEKLSFAFTIDVPDGATVSVGDTALTSDLLVSEGNPYPVWNDIQEVTELESIGNELASQLSEQLRNQPRFSRYSCSVLYYELPTVTAVSSDGTPLSAISPDDGRYLFTLPSNEEDEAVVQRAEEFIRSYINFSTNENGNAYGNLYKLLPNILVDTRLYNRMTASADGMYWVSGRTITYNSLEVSDVSVYGDILATCRVSFSVNNTTKYGTSLMENVYDLALVNTNGSWYVVSMADVESY
ncbi:MAG: hypothetical protein E7420_01910 [Ruminococcaceae bacterium]|nr:hypothetical protein [Oscillospiraceae bacterium]